MAPSTTQNDPPTAEMPRYRCHKEVHALKIKDLLLSSNGETTMTFEDEGFASRVLNRDWLVRHGPRPGGYLVVYKDGYESFSPAEAFEDGYTRIT